MDYIDGVFDLSYCLHILKAMVAPNSSEVNLPSPLPSPPLPSPPLPSPPLPLGAHPAMGQYQTRSAKSSEEPEEVGLREAREKREVREGEPTPIPELVIGSPIDSELLLDDTSFTV